MSGVTRFIGHKILDYPTHLILNALTPKPPTRRLGDIAAQTAQEGGARPIVWGRVRPIGGNILHVQAPQKRMLKVKAEGGKGGGKKKKQKEEHVFRTYAIGICEGPVSGVTRAWRNDKLVYDARGNAWGARNNGVFLRGFRFYLGNYGQLPDSWLERVWGIGNVPAYRGTCYMVANDEDLTELGGAIPQWTFEVEREESLYIESALYPLGENESISTGAAFEGGALKGNPKELEQITTAANFEGGALQSILLKMDAANEAVSTSAQFEGGQLKTILQKQDGGQEQITTAANFEGGELKAILIQPNPFYESITTGATLEGGSLQ